MENKLSFCLMMVLLTGTQAQAADSSATLSPPPPPADGASSSSTSTATEQSRPIRYQGAVTYQTSRTAGNDLRAFKTVATDDSGQMNTSSSLPNLNYMSARLGVSPWVGHTISMSTLQSLDSAATRTIPGNGGDMHTLPGSIYSARYGYRINTKWSMSAGENYVPEQQGWSDPQLNATYRPKEIWEQGWAPRFGIGVSVPTTLRSHDDHVITQATARTGLSYVTGRWTTSGSLAYSRAIYEHPSQLAANPWGAPVTTSQGGTPAPLATPGGHHHHAHAVDPSLLATLPPPDPNSFDTIAQERSMDRSSGSMGVVYMPSDHWKIGSGAGVTYIETFGDHAIWFTNVRVIGAVYDFWKMEAGSDVSIYSNVDKYQHPSLPSLMAVGFHLSYFMGANHNVPLN